MSIKEAGTQLPLVITSWEMCERGVRRRVHRKQRRKRLIVRIWDDKIGYTQDLLPVECGVSK